MKSREQRTQALLLNEIASKSIPASLSFALFALFVFFYRYNLVHLRPYLQASCVGVIFASSLRIYISRHFDKNDHETYWKLVRISVWLNTLCWTVIFGCAGWELESTGYHYVAAMILMTGYASASIVTLAYDKWLFFPFNVFIIGVPGIIATYHGIVFRNNAYFAITTSFIFLFIYQCRQYREYRHVLEQRFRTQVDLEDSNETLIHQTVQLVQASKASALGEMAGGLSHEVNNSLMVILGTIQQLERKMKSQEKPDPDSEKKFGRITESIQKIKTVIDGLKYFSMEREHVPMEKVHLTEIIERTLNYCQEMLKAHRIHLTVGNVPDVSLKCHQMELTQVMFSIFKNADEVVTKLDAESDRWIKLKFRELPGRIHISIVNGGPLIDPKIREKIFQPFFTTKDVGEGMGLSLSIAKGIMKEHGGDLTIDADENSTCFILDLPVA